MTSQRLVATLSLGLCVGLIHAQQSISILNDASYNLAPFPPAGNVARNSIVAAFGSGFTNQTVQATSVNPLPTTLGGVSLEVDGSSAGGYACYLHPGIYAVSPNQINFVIPAGTDIFGNDCPIGSVTVYITSAQGGYWSGGVQVSYIAPGIFTANSAGSGLAAGQLARYTKAGAPISSETLSPSGNVLNPDTENDYLNLYGTGFRYSSWGNAFYIGGISVPIAYLGSQNQYPGMDQLNIGPLPASVKGLGQTNMQLTIQAPSYPPPPGYWASNVIQAVLQ